VKDGNLVAAVEEERFTRIKHWAGFPAESIKYCLREAGVNVHELDHVAVSFNPRVNISNKLLFAFRNRPDTKSIIDRFKRQSKSFDIIHELGKACSSDTSSIKAKLHHVEHHMAHLASTYFVSPFDKAAILSIDGMGDFVSTLTAGGEENNFTVFNRIYYPHSLGFLYCAMTMLLGFPNYGDEYKVMGLAPYGNPSMVDEFRKIIYQRDPGFELNLDYFNHHRKGISMLWENGSPKVEPFHSKLMKRVFDLDDQLSFGWNGHRENVAASLQLITEETIINLLNNLYKQYPCENLCLAGGVAMNSVVNGKIHRQTPFKNVYVPPGAADNGGAFGAAFFVWHSLLKQPRQFILKHAFWGPEFGESEVTKTIDSHKEEILFNKYEREELINKVVDALCEGNIIGWYQGRMEFGARALGNRSLLADPRRSDARDIINLKIKFREKFRPFAPSVLRETVSEFFEDDISSPFMEKVVPIKNSKRGLIPAVTHVDGSGRLQTVDQDTNSLYYDLIKKFGERTGIPLVLNTSLNENEPIVCTPEEAIQCFLRTRMDIMVLGNYLIKRAFETR
jgi:carbamoyltransferase